MRTARWWPGLCLLQTVPNSYWSLKWQLVGGATLGSLEVGAGGSVRGDECGRANDEALSCMDKVAAGTPYYWTVNSA